MSRLDPILSEPGLWLPLLAIVAVFLVALFRERRLKARIAAGDPDARMEAYALFMIQFWVLAAVCMLGWVVSGGTLDSLGLGLGSTPAWTRIAGWALALGGIAYLVYSIWATLRSPEARASVEKQLADGADLSLVLPANAREARRFRLVAVTAGVTEEVIFRGFLIGTFALVLPLWLAALASLAVFVAGHSYQGVAGMARIVPVSAVLTLIFLLTGSLWPAVLLHIATDLAGGEMVRAVQRHAGTPSASAADPA